AAVGPMRARYEALMAAPDELEDILQMGAAKARRHAQPLMDAVREAVGLRAARATVAAAAPAPARPAGKLARFVSFREKDGSFHFRMLAGDGEALFVSRGFADPKAAGAAI